MSYYSYKDYHEKESYSISSTKASLLRVLCITNAPGIQQIPLPRTVTLPILSLSLSLYIYIYMYIYIYAHMYICIYLYMFMCVYMHVCGYIYIYTHTYVHIRETEFCGKVPEPQTIPSVFTPLWISLKNLSLRSYSHSCVPTLPSRRLHG